MAEIGCHEKEKKMEEEAKAIRAFWPFISSLNQEQRKERD